MFVDFGDHLAKLLVIEGEHAGVFAIELHLLMVTIMLLVVKMLMGMITIMIWMLKSLTFTTGRGFAVVKSPWDRNQSRRLKILFITGVRRHPYPPSSL